MSKLKDALNKVTSPRTPTKVSVFQETKTADTNLMIRVGNNRFLVTGQKKGAGATRTFWVSKDDLLA